MLGSLGENTMALPPIITDSPIFKVLTGTPAKPANTPQPEEKKADAPQAHDSVTLSDAALKKLGETQQSSPISSADEARSAAAQIRADLQSNPDQVLGLQAESA
jgi:hypothetical protein